MDFERSQIWRELTGDPGNYYCQASDMERDVFKKWLRCLLAERVVTVDFTKATGEFRSMKCTLNTELGAKYVVNENKTKPAREPNPDVCVVWDVAQSAWRSFRWDRIKRIAFDLG
jgi:hypothetical protein